MAVYRLEHTYGLLLGRKAVFSIGHDLGWEVVIDLYDLRLKIVAILDCREEGQSGELLEEPGKYGIRILRGWVAMEARGSKRVEGATVVTTGHRNEENGMRRDLGICGTNAGSGSFESSPEAVVHLVCVGRDKKIRPIPLTSL